MSLSLLALALIAGSSVSWSGLDLFRKVLVTRFTGMALLFALTAGLLPFFYAWGLWQGFGTIQPGYWWPAFWTFALNVVANLLFFEAARVSPLSLTIPFLSFTPVFASLVGIVLFGDVPGLAQAAGILLVVVGAFLLNSAGGSSPAALFKAFREERGSVLMVAVALCWSLTISLDKIAVERSSAPLHAILLNLAIGTLALGYLAVRRRLGEIAALRAAPWPVFGALVVGSLALGLQLAALRVASPSLVETLKRGIGNGLAPLLGRAFFDEPLSGRIFFAVALMAAGAALVLLA